MNSLLNVKQFNTGDHTVITYKNVNLADIKILAIENNIISYEYPLYPGSSETVITSVIDYE
jgi:hypothetical protein